MKIVVHREIYRDKSTIGGLSIDGALQCYTLEDTVRKPNDKKVYGETAIPTGTYPIILRKEGTTHVAYLKRFPDMHRGTLWLRNILEYEYVLIHVGNVPADTLGCILVGETYNSADPDRISGS